MHRNERITNAIAVGVFAFATLCASAQEMEYKTAGDCAGFPKLHLTTKSGLCVGLVASHLGFVRGVAVAGDSIFVADMGEWDRGHGRIWRIGALGHGKAEVILDKLDEPNALLLSPRGTIYVGELGKIIEFDPKAQEPAKTVRDVVIGLPDSGRHPLPALAQSDDGALFMNVGAASNNCEAAPGELAKDGLCFESGGSKPRGVILRVMPEEGKAVDAWSGDIVARGLRNSMALAVFKGNTLLAAVNARDAINQADPKLSDEDLPHDTLDVIELGADYGWPYCYDNNVPSPEYRSFDCSHKHVPTMLLPAHAAPLGMIVYQGDMLPGFRDHLLIGYHGFRKSGHRIVALALDSKGQPVGNPEEIISHWEFVKRDHPQGAPVALALLPDGSILVTEDLNGTLLRIAASGAKP